MREGGFLLCASETTLSGFVRSQPIGVWVKLLLFVSSFGFSTTRQEDDFAPTSSRALATLIFASSPTSVIPFDRF